MKDNIMKKKTKLPDKLSDLIRIAVADAKKIEKDSKYIFNMSTWHQPQSNYDDVSHTFVTTGKCEVCFAGSIIACTLKAKPNQTVDTSDFDEDTDRKLELIDQIRTGSILILTNNNYEEDMYYLKVYLDNINPTIEKVNELINSKYDLDLGRAPWVTYLKAADMLQKVGL